MDIQRVRNLSTGILHTNIKDVYEDIYFITGINVFTHQIPAFIEGLSEFLRNILKDEMFFDGIYNPNHTGDVFIEKMDKDKLNIFLKKIGA